DDVRGAGCGNRVREAAGQTAPTLLVNEAHEASVLARDVANAGIDHEDTGVARARLHPGETSGSFNAVPSDRPREAIRHENGAFIGIDKAERHGYTFIMSPGLTGSGIFSGGSRKAINFRLF